MAWRWRGVFESSSSLLKSLALKSLAPINRTGVEMDPKQLIEIDPEKMSGTPLFKGTRVPGKNLFDYLEGGIGLEVFLDDFPTVSREQAVGVLELSKESILSHDEVAA
jgi:uncharacterized protein (DUF433 family)